MKILSIIFLGFTMLGLTGAEASFAPVIQWSGYKAKAVKAPQVSQVKGPNGKNAVRIEAVAKGKFQGATGTFAPPADFSKYSAIEFYIRHNIPGPRGSRGIAIHMDSDTGKINGNFAAPNKKWSKVVIPLDKDSFKAERGNTVNFSTVTSMRIAPFSYMNTPGKFIEIADFKLLPKTSGTQQLKVMKYIHAAKPTSGENGTTLTDGNKKKNIHYRQFSDDPIITFDLGGKFTIDRIKVYANTAPSHNFAEIAIFAGVDHKVLAPSGILRNDKTGTKAEVAEYTFRSSDRPVVGRYIQLRATRPRSDFPVDFSEVEFFGHTPTEAELLKAAELNYDNGVPMPERNNKNYAVFQQGDYKLYISRKNGVVNGLYYKNKLIAERITPKYTMQTRKEDTFIDGNKDQVQSIKNINGKVIVDITNPQLPDLKLRRIYYVVKNALFERVEIEDLGMKERKFLRLASEVILEQNFRSQGFYEMPGTALAVGMFRLPAGEVQMDRSLTNIPTIGFENAVTRQVIWHTRFKFNDRFTYMDVCTEEENLQTFRANGWRITSATIVPLDRKVHSFENRFSVTDGGMLKAYDEYISTPEAAAFRSQVKRPKWLRDLRCSVSTGWDGSYKSSGQRYMANLYKGFSPRGYLSDPAMYDTNGIWGDVLSEGENIYGWFGNRSTAEELREKIRSYKKINPNIKLSYYTWFWSAFPWSTPVKNHPEWFVKTLRNGSPASWFPQINVNYLRFWGIKESRDEAKNQIVKFIKAYKQDHWYLDGGKSGAYAKDWDTMRIDDPLGQTDFYSEVRKALQKDDPDTILFFNHSENPLADIGYLESFGGTLTNEWRRGAILMWKFKMYAYKDPLHHSVYIYWLPGVDGAFHNYIAGIGVTASYNSRSFTARDLPYLAARYEIRQAQITDADVKPDWRMDAKEDVECMTLHQGSNGWIFINPHITKPETREISSSLKAMNIKDPDKPVYLWRYTIKNGKKFRGLFSERDLAAAYAKHGWITDRAVVPFYLGKHKYTERFSYKVPLKVNEAQVLMFTQVPAAVLSIENEPSHYYLAGQPGIELDGNDGRFTVKSEYKTAEIGMLLEKNQQISSVKVNGTAVEAELRIENNMRWAVVKVGKGESVITLEVRKGKDIFADKLNAKLSKRTLTVDVEPANAMVQIYNGGNLVLSRTGSFVLELPDTVRDGIYIVKSGKQQKKLKFRKLGKPLKLQRNLQPLQDRFEVKAVSKTVKNIKVSSYGTLCSLKASQAQVDLDALRLTTGTLRNIENHFNRTGAMLEIQAKRYLKVRMHNGFWYANNYGLQPQNHAVRKNRSSVFGGLIFDFADSKDYIVRSAAGLGLQTDKRKSKNPECWGKKSACDNIYMLDDLLISKTNKVKEFWIDLKTLGAPENWSGKLALTLYMEDICPNREVSLEILAACDKLPAGAAPLKPIQLGKIESKVILLKKISGKVNPEKLQLLGDLTATKLTMAPLKTTIRAGWDDKNLYFYYTAQETPGRKPNTEGAKINKPWFGDSVEFFIGKTSEPEMAYHIIIDAANCRYAEDMTLQRKAGDKNILHPSSPVKADWRIKSGSWTCLLSVPWSVAGGRPAAGAPVPFNLMRNRLDQGKSSNYTLAPNKEYFTGKQYQFKLTE